MNLYKKNRKSLESAPEIGTALLKMIGNNLEIKQWKFQLTFTKFTEASHIKIIYDSEWCRVKFLFSRRLFPDKDELSVNYGRLHAPNDEPFIFWNGQECRCWHNIWHPLYFLDGLSPAEAVRRADMENKLPAFAESFWNSKRGISIREKYTPEYSIILQSELWKHYRKRLFQLFDIRHPDLWDQYKHFLREYYKLLGRNAIYGPPYENVC